MKIEERNIETIIPYEKNPRKNDDAVKYVANSIKEFGFKVPIIVDKNGIVVAGHTRLKAAKDLGMKTVPVIVADDLTEAQVKAFRIADNKTSDQASWDTQLLGEELNDLLNIGDFDMTDFGFGDFEITMLTEDFEPEPYDDEMVESYSEGGNVSMKNRILITYTDDQIDDVKRLLGLEGNLKVVYDISEFGEV